MIALRLTIHGRVQGVFYRDWTIRNARRLGLSGWVRNEPDGTVSAQVQGEDGAVNQMVELMRQGPPAARVERIEQAQVEPETLEGFSRR